MVTSRSGIYCKMYHVLVIKPHYLYRQRFQRSWVGLTSERNIYMAKKALQYIKSKLTEFRSEERRKVMTEKIKLN